jgi:CelD/BcsL family acetyltransferase involved in cellulose biosynthesis
VRDTPSINTAANLDVRLYSSFDEPEIAAPAWNDLVARSDTNTVFQTHEWLTSWWQVFGVGRELLLIAVFGGDRLVGLAPLMQDRTGGAPTIRFISDGNADYCDFLLAEPRLPVLQRILATLAWQPGGWRALHLNNIPQQSFTARNIGAACAGSRLLPLVRSEVDCPALVFG